jgi:hypothetical protein
VNIEDASEEELITLKEHFRELSGADDHSTHSKSISTIHIETIIEPAAAPVE